MAKHRKRGSGGKNKSSSSASDSEATAAAPISKRPSAGERHRSYSKLLSHVASALSRDVELFEEKQQEPPTKKKRPSELEGGDPHHDADDISEADEEDIALADDGGAEEEEQEEEADELDDVDAMQWRSASYDKHYGSDWPTSALDAQSKAHGEKELVLPGLGVAKAFVPSKSAAAAAATTAAAASGASAEAFMKKCGVLPGMRTAWVKAHGDEPLTEQQASLLALLSSRADVHCTKTPLTAYAELTPILALHAASHIVLTQKMLARHRKKGLTPADQGFTRPTVLVLLPFRSHALAFVRALLEVLPPCYEQVENKARFFKEYDEEEGSPPMPASKPNDYKELFDGNNDDCFRCALRLTRKACKLYSGFYAADLIVGSPLGLRTLLGGEGKGGKKGKKGKGAKEPGATVAGDADWLTSVELCLVPYADVLLMQNWAHVSDVFELLNRLPTQQRDTDFSRVRPWYLEGDARRLRQTALLSAHQSAELSALLARGCSNVAGRIATRPSYDGLLSHAPSGIRQLFVRFDASDPASEAEQRLAAFKDRLLPSLLTAMTAAVGAAQTLLFVPRYFDFVRVRSLLVAEDVPFVAVSEYSTPSQVGKARHALQTKEVPLLLYTERAHFFRRHKLRGARHLAVYSPPSYPHFYTELMQQLDRATEAAGAAPVGGAGAASGAAAGDATCVTLFCRLDAYPLQRLVGTERASKMVGSQQESSFLFC